MDHPPPVVDLAPLLKDGEISASKRLELLGTIHKACKEFGLFQLVNHGLDPRLLNNVLQSGEKFFELPLDYKCKFSTDNNTLGFVHRSGAVGGPPDRKEHFFCAVEDNPVSKSNKWPDSPSSFRSDIIALEKPMQELCQIVTILLAETLGVSKDILSNCFRKSESYCNLLHYPASCDYDGQILAPHQDGTIFTLVSQLNRVPGYQVLKGDTWYMVMPEENALIVNIGDLLQMWTNGLYKGAVHRVVANKERRFSFVYSFFPEANVEVAPLSCFSGNSPRYKSFLCKDYMKLRFENKRLGNTLGRNITIDYYAYESAA